MGRRMILNTLVWRNNFKNGDTKYTYKVLKSSWFSFDQKSTQMSCIASAQRMHRLLGASKYHFGI